MKQLVKKPVHHFIATIIVLLLCYSCNKQPVPESINENEGSGSKINTIKDFTNPNPFHQRVGAPIDGRTGAQWINNYKKAHNGYTKTYTLKNDYLQDLVKLPNCVGISMHYAIDTYGKTHIIPIGVNKYAKFMQCNSIPTMGANMKWVNISWLTAQQWIAKDKGALDSHFFGSNTFARLNETYCKTIRVDYAIDDKNKQALLLSNTCEINFAKRYEDLSSPCPSFCPSSSN